jgi:hypothetical protein
MLTELYPFFQNRLRARANILFFLTPLSSLLFALFGMEQSRLSGPWLRMNAKHGFFDQACIPCGTGHLPELACKLDIVRYR